MRLWAAAARRGVAAAAVLVVAVAAILLLIRPSGRHPDRAATPPQQASAKPAPTLYCEFYNFMHNATVVSFLFAVDLPAGGAPRFSEMATMQPDGTQTGFDEDQRPQWSRDVVDGTAEITSPDGATRIVLYGFEPNVGGVFWTEAGIRSDTYKNLDGKCRQAYFGRT